MIDKQQISTWKILVVDDEPDSLEVVTRVLTFHGAQVMNASNGKEALEKIAEMRPTFILSDLSMPVMDGWEMLYHLQSDPRTKDIPIIALTAHAMSGDRERAVGAGFHYYLTKPLSPLTFLSDLMRLFSDMSLAAARPDGNGNGSVTNHPLPSLPTTPAAHNSRPALTAPPLAQPSNDHGHHPLAEKGSSESCQTGTR